MKKRVLFFILLGISVSLSLFAISLSGVSAGDGCGAAGECACLPNFTCDTSDLKPVTVEGGECGFRCYVTNEVAPTPKINSTLTAIACGPNNTGIQTAIGCIPVLGSTDDFLGVLLKWAVGVGGGIAFMLMLYAGFMIMTAQGSPERMKAGQELLTSAIAGLILLIFSVFILNFIGVDILGLDNFGFGK